VGLDEGKGRDGIVGMFDRTAATYDRIGPRMFSLFGERLVDLARLAPGDQVLDVAAGRGAVLFPAGKRVGPDGRAIGIDLSADMVRETAAEIEGAQWRHVSIRQMDAQELQFPDASFDRVLCGFSLWFFPQPHRALQEFRRVLKPGGRVGLTTWARECPFLRWCLPELATLLPPYILKAAVKPGGSRFDTPELLAEALGQAGFSDIRFRSEEEDFVYARDEEWWLSLWTHGMRSLFEQLEAPVLAQVKADLLRKAQALKQPDGIHSLFRALFAMGARPGNDFKGRDTA